jgi:hypothetical protein
MSTPKIEVGMKLGQGDPLQISQELCYRTKACLGAFVFALAFCKAPNFG